MTPTRILQLSALLTLALDAAAADRGQAEFVGSSPCDAEPRAFLGGVAPGAPCMFIAWRLTLASDRATGRPTRYDLVAAYGIPRKDNPNVAEDGPRVERHGAWDLQRGSAADPDAVVFRLLGSEPGRSLSFVRVGDRLLHLLEPDQGLRVGNGGWSYTLNLAGADALGAAAAARANPPAPPRAGAPLAGVFDGRTPCRQLAKQLGVAVSGECDKMKWRLRLREDPTTHAPTTYVLEGSPYRSSPRTGRWAVERGSKGVVYRLDPDSPRSLAFFRADDNLLLFLGEDGELLVGDADFSYTLNRVPARAER